MEIVNYGEVKNLTNFLNQNPNIYAIDSKLSGNLKYIIENDELIVAYDDGEVHHKISKIKDEVSVYIEPVKREILAIYEDIKDLARMEIVWQGRKRI